LGGTHKPTKNVNGNQEKKPETCEHAPKYKNGNFCPKPPNNTGARTFPKGPTKQQRGGPKSVYPRHMQNNRASPKGEGNDIKGKRGGVYGGGKKKKVPGKKTKNY